MFVATVLTAFAVVSLFLLPIIRKQLESPIPGSYLIPMSAFLLAGLAWAGSCTTEVPEGSGGIRKTFGAASDIVLPPGLAFKYPWQEVELMSTRAMVLSSQFDAQSSDLQKISVQMSIVYRRKFDQLASIYKRVRQNSEGVDVVPAGREVNKATLSKFKAPDLIAGREAASTEIFNLLSSRLEGYGLEVVAISIGQIDFDDLYDKTIEAKVIAGESAKMQENVLVEQTTRAEIREAEQKGIAEGKAERARGDAEATRLKASAEAYKVETLGLAQAAKTRIEGQAEAERAQLVARALRGNPEVLRFEAARQWNGKLPELAQGLDGLNLPFTLVPNVKEEGEPETIGVEGAQEIDRKVEDFLQRVNQTPSVAKPKTENPEAAK